MYLKKTKEVLNNPLYIFFILTFGYFATRLINLDLIPIFNDESTYIRSGLNQILEPIFKPYSLLIGKEPLMPQLFGAIGSATGDYLIGARLVSVFFGFLTFTGLFLLALKLEGEKTAAFAGVLYILSPFNLFFDRLALLESAVSAVAVWSLYLTYSIIKKPDWQTSVFLGCILGVGLYIKTTAFFFLGLVGISALTQFILSKSNAENKNLSVISLLFSIFIAIVIYLPLYSSEYYSIHLELLKQYTYPLSSVFTFPLSIWLLNLEKSVSWIVMFLTLPMIILGIYGMTKNLKKSKYLLIYFWLIFPFIYEVLYAKLFSGRHVLILSVPIIFFAAWTMNFLLKTKRNIFYFVLAAVILMCVLYDLFIVFRPLDLNKLYVGKAKSDIGGYFSGFASGYGVMESINYLKEKSKDHEIMVLVRNDHGNPEDAVIAYLSYNPKISIGLMSKEDQIKEAYASAYDKQEIYFVSRGAYFMGLEKYLILEKKFSKPNGSEFVGVYKVKF